jgi:hypothetical protein
MCSDINSSSFPIDDFYYKEFSSNQMGCVESQKKKSFRKYAYSKYLEKKSDTEPRCVWDLRISRLWQRYFLRYDTVWPGSDLSNIRRKVLPLTLGLKNLPSEPAERKFGLLDLKLFESAEDLTAMTMKRNSVWNVTPCSMVELHRCSSVTSTTFYQTTNKLFGFSRYWLWDGRLRGRSSSSGDCKNFLFCKSLRLALGSTQPPIQWVPGALSSGVKRPGREAEHSPATSVEVKKMWIYTSTLPYAFMAWCLVS